jgi:hypothetical protein
MACCGGCQGVAKLIGLAPPTSPASQQGQQRPLTPLNKPSSKLVLLSRVKEHYDFDASKLGEGAYGSVCKATHKVDRAIRAIKKISFASEDAARLRPKSSC